MQSNSRNQQVSYDHQHLLVKQCRQQIKRYPLNLRQKLIDMNINYYELDAQKRNEVLNRVIEQVSSEQGGQLFMEFVRNRLKEQVDQLYSSDSRKNTYLIDCLREATSFPVIKERDVNLFNFSALHGRDMSKQLRRLVWSKQFNNTPNRMAFQKLNREITPYKIEEELKMGLEKIISKQHLNMKQNQKDMAVKIMEFIVKAHGKLTHKYHNYVVLIVVDLFSFYNLNKILDVGATCLGLIQLIEYYHQPNSDLRFQRIIRTIEIIDPESFSFIKEHYLTPEREIQSRRQLNECYEYFRLTAGASYLSLQVSQFIVDQLIIRKRCKLDSYTIFAMLILIISDQFVEEANRPSLKEIIERGKQIVKKQDYMDAFKTIYNGIPTCFNFDHFQQQPNNKLFAEMISFQKANYSTKQGQKPIEDDDEFVVNIGIARMGNKL